MNQSLNILRKDTAQMLPQLLMPILTLTLFTALESRSWGSGPPLMLSSAALTHVLALAFSMIWVVLTISLVQAERLVGLNQFWTTRPYVWSSLIAAKCYFLLAYLYLPLILSQLILLHLAHLSVLHSIPALLYNLVLLTVLLILPVVCAAALTRSIGQAMLVLLVFLSMLVGVASFSSLFKGMAPRSLLLVQIAIIAAAVLSALLNQYRNRTTQRSLILLAPVPVLIVLLQVTLPGTSLAALGYPLLAGDPPVTVRFDTDPTRAFGSPVPSNPDAHLFLHLPLLLSGMAPGTSFALEGHRLLLTAANGDTWQSPWLAQIGLLASASPTGQLTGYAEFSIPRDVYDRLRTSAVSVRIDFALAQLQDQPPVQSTLTTAGDTIPLLGFCSLDESYEVVNCHSAFQNPPRFAVKSFRKVGACTDPDAKMDPSFGSVGSSGPASVLPHISSVDVTPVQLSISRASYLCPGLPVTFIEKRFQRRLQIQMPPATVHLSDYIGSTRNIQ